MTQSAAKLNDLLALAHAGDEAALGCLLDEHRAYLRVLAERKLGGRFQARLDGSDVVQQTCLSAYRNFGQFRGRDMAQFMGWLRKIHKRNIKDAVRDHAQTAKRDVGREKPQATGSQLFDPLVKNTSPSQRLMRSEESRQLSQALDTLPVEQREVVRLRHIEGLLSAEIATVLGKTEGAVAGLLTRGLKELRRTIGNEG